MPDTPIVSIIIATYNRLERLKRCIGALRFNVQISREIVVVGGAAPDGTTEWCRGQSDIRFIEETAREGATKAYNKGFRAATGRFAMWLNDDAVALPSSIEAAVRMIERPDLADVGMIAFYHNFNRTRNRLDTILHHGEEFSIYNVRGYPYANFGLLRRDLLERLGYLDERYYFSAWDPDLSLKVQLNAGLKVIGCREALIDHEELHDERKTDDLPALDRDNELLFAKWNLPARNSYPDPAPAYQQMIRERLIVDADRSEPACPHTGMRGDILSTPCD